MTEPKFVPPDVVPRRQVQRDALLALNSAVGEVCVVYTPGELLEDVDGAPLGVSDSEFQHFTMARPTVHLAAVQAAGLTAADLPNLRIIDSDKESK